MLRKLWRDECGAVVSAEIVVIVSVLVIALMVGWALLRNVVFVELSNQAEWIAGHDEPPMDHIITIEEIDIDVCADVFNNNGEGDAP